MYRETYNKFYVLVILALVIGFVGMEISSGPLERLTGHVVQESGSLMSFGNMIFLLVGLFAGAAIIGTLVYIYSKEKRQDRENDW